MVYLAVVAGCGSFEKQNRPEPLAQRSKPTPGEAKILQPWQGDFPVAQAKLLPEGQREKPVDFIKKAKTFEGVWEAFKSGEAIQEIDFKG